MRIFTNFSAGDRRRTPLNSPQMGEIEGNERADKLSRRGNVKKRMKLLFFH